MQPPSKRSTASGTTCHWRRNFRHGAWPQGSGEGGQHLLQRGWHQVPSPPRWDVLQAGVPGNGEISRCPNVPHTLSGSCHGPAPSGYPRHQGPSPWTGHLRREDQPSPASKSWTPSTPSSGPSLDPTPPWWKSRWTGGAPMWFGGVPWSRMRPLLSAASPRQPAGTDRICGLSAPAHRGECGKRGFGLQAGELLHQVCPRLLGEVGVWPGPELGEPLGIHPEGAWHPSSRRLCLQVLRWPLEGRQGQQPAIATDGLLGWQADELATHPGPAPGEGPRGAPLEGGACGCNPWWGIGPQLSGGGAPSFLHPEWHGHRVGPHLGHLVEQPRAGWPAACCKQMCSRDRSGSAQGDQELILKFTL